MRFHFGVSFNPKKLIKWILLFLFVIFSFVSIHVSAEEIYGKTYTNYDSSFNFVYDQVDFDAIEFSTNYTMQDILNEYLGYESSYYNIFIKYSIVPESVSIVLIPKDYSIKSVNFTGINQINSSPHSVSIAQQYITNGYSANIYKSSSTESSINALFEKLNNCLDNNVCTGLSPSPNIWFYANTDSLDNDSSYTFNLSTNTGLFTYYSQVPLTYNKSLSPGKAMSSQIYYLKSVSFNGNVLDTGDTVPTYCDIYDCDGSSNIDWLPYSFEKFGDIFVSNVSKDKLSDIKIDFSFNFYDTAFVDDLKFQTILYGRKNKSTYYTYENLEDCKIFSNIAKGKKEITYTFTGLSCSNTLENYDNIYIQLRPYNYDHTTNVNIYNPIIKTNYGFIDHIENGSAHFTIMEHFSDLPNNFNMILSTLENLSYATFHSSHNNVLMSNINRSDNRIGHVATSQIASYGKSDFTNLILYNYASNYSGLTNLNVFFHSTSILSYSTNNNFSYYDSTDNITNNSITNMYQTIYDSTVDSNSSFFENFTDNDHGLSGIVTAPLVLIKELNSGTTCTPLTLPILGKNISIPSGCILWEKVPNEIEVIYHIFVGGFLAYIIATNLFHDVNNLKDPEKSEVSTLDL